MSTKRVASDTWSAKAHPEAHAAADRLPQFLRDASGQGARRKAPRLRMGDQPCDAATQFEAVLRQLRALAGARIAGDDEHLPMRQRLQDGLAPRRNRQFGIVLEQQLRRCARGRPPGRAVIVDHRSLATLDGLPETLLGGEIQFREYLAALRRQRLHAAKAPLEFCVGRAQCCLGVDIEFARQIGGREQQIADFFENLAAARRVCGGRVVRSRLPRTSANSSSTLSALWPACSKSNPTRAARLLSL